MKKSKNVVAILMACLSTASLFGCSIKRDNTTKSDEYTLEIESIDAGYGITWLQELAKNFEDDNPGYEVIVTPSRNFDMAESYLRSGPNNNTADIMIYQYPYYMSLVSERLGDGGEILADLTDVYEQVAEGASKSVKESLDPNMLNLFDYNGTGRYYAFPTLNDTNGLTYNVDMFAANGWAVPNTTDELFELAETIRDGGKVKPFAWIAGYWEYCTSVWWAQYEGLENYEKFYRPDYDIAPNDAASGYNQKGREEALTVLENLISPENRFSIDGCLSLEFSEIQAAYMKKEQAAMMPNGGWMVHEQKNEALGNKFAMMKLPIVSALGEKLGITDSKLSDIIDYVDGKTAETPTVESRTGYTAEYVIETVREARYLNSSSIAYTNVALIPAYSDAIPLAKKFLLYMTTREAMQITFEESGQMPLIASEIDSLDTSTMNVFNKSKVELMKAANNRMVSMEMCCDPLFYMNGLRAYTQQNNITPEKTLAAASTKDRRSATDIFSSEKTYMAAQWEHYVRIAKGVLNQ